ncbi:MAG TPA: MFS transporter [Candidatus Cybelea sp.]|nr:MFS transporter [Candidatus Cybelea sp.]
MASRLFYGWIVVGAAFVLMLLSYGTAYSFAAFFASLQKEFNASRGDISLVFSLSGFLYFSLGAVSGRIADRIGPRIVCIFGMLLIGVGLLLAARAQSLLQVYLSYGAAVGLGIGFAYVPAIGAVQRWFVRRRGFASGLAVAGIGVGNLVMPPLAEIMIGRVGWRETYSILGIVIAVFGIGAALLIEQSPARRGLNPDGDASPSAAAANHAASGATVGEALRSRVFWLIYIASGLSGFALFVPFVHLAAYARDHGLSESTGVQLFGLIGAGSVAGRFLLGSLADRFGRRRSYLAMFLGMMIMDLWWLGASGPIGLAIFALAFGMFYGGFVALAPALTGDYFGARNVSAIIGLLYTSVSFGTLFGPWTAGIAFDLTQSYTLPILAGAAVNLCAVACMALVPDPKTAKG